MKAIIQIVVFMLFALMGTRSFAQNNIQGSWESAFTTDTLSTADVSAFEERGIQKVRDFYNFLGIVCSPQYDKKLREAARDQAMDLFYDSACSIDNRSSVKYLDSCLKKAIRTSFQVSDVQIKQVLKLDVNTHQYKGTLTYTIEDGWGHKHDKIATLVLCKRAKKFGADTKQVWTVFICDIK